MPTEATTQAPVTSPLLRGKLAGLGSAYVRVCALTTLARLTGSIILTATAVMILDWWWELDWGVRAALLLGCLAYWTWIVVEEFVLPYRRRPDEETAALWVEKEHPALRTRLIAAVQLGASPTSAQTGSPALIRALIRETEAAVGDLDFKAIIKTGRQRRFLILGAMVVLTGSLAFHRTLPVSADLLRRFWLSAIDVPRKTRVQILTGDKVIGRGDSVILAARAAGFMPGFGTLTLHHENGRQQELLLDADRRDGSVFARELVNVQESFTYQVRLNDGSSRQHRVQVVPRPEAAFVECQQIYPAYTGLPPVKRALGDLGLLAGSRLKLRISATREVARGTLRLAGTQQSVPLQIIGSGAELTGELPIPATNLTGFSVVLADRHGIQTRDPALYRLDILPDQPPAVQITYPDRREELVTRRARLLVAFEASDDFGIRQVALKYTVDTQPLETNRTVPMELGQQTPRTLKRRYDWDLARISPPPPEGSSIEYWIEVQDANNITGPGRGSSDHFVARVVSEEDKRADLLNRASDYLGGIGEVATDQEKLSENLGGIILEKRPTQP
jgi:hypothetical protein